MKIKKQLTLLAFCLVIIFSGFIVRHENRETELKKNFLTQAQLVSKQTGRLLQTQINDIKSELQVQAEAPEIINAESNPAACQQKLEKVYRHIQNKVSNLSRATKDGTFICAINTLIIGKKAQDFGGFFDEIKNDPLHQPVLSRKFSPLGHTGYGVTIQVPVSSKTFTDTIGGGLYFDRIEDYFFTNLPFQKSGFVSLFDDNGEILHNDDTWSEGKIIWSDEVLKRFNLPPEFAEMAKAATKDQSTNRVFTQNGPVQEKFLAISLEPVNLLPNRRWVVMVTIPFSDNE